MFELDSFDPLLHTTSKATVSFAFSDGRRRGDVYGDWADIQVGSDWMWTGLEVDGTKRGGFDWVSTVLGDHLLEEDLQRDGSIGYLVRAIDFGGWRNRNDFHFERASITAWGNENVSHHNVPDGGHSLILLAIGLVALLVWARFAKKRSFG